MPGTIKKCFALTSAFEGGGYANLAGSFDGQGVSFGFLCWNLGSGTLQTLLKAMQAEGPATFERCFTQPVNNKGRMVVTNLAPDILAVCNMSNTEAVHWAEKRQDSKHRLLPHWVAAFKDLAQVPGFNAVQRKHAHKPYMVKALSYVAAYGFKSERALALMFDICVQMGSIRAPSRARYNNAFCPPMDEEARLVLLARSVAPQGGRWAQDVLARKMTIAKGGGIVHGRSYQLERDFGITMAPVS